VQHWQTIDPTVPIALLLAGVAVGVLGVLATIAWRRPEQTITNLFWAGSNIAAHPERYVVRERVSIIRAVNMTGVVLWLAGVLVIVWRVVRAI
jgi:hypothetical protein